MKTASLVIRRGLHGGGPSFLVPDLWTAGAAPGGRLIPENQCDARGNFDDRAIQEKARQFAGRGRRPLPSSMSFPGLVKSCRLLPDHKKHIVGFRFAHDLVGLPENGRYVNTAEAAPQPLHSTKCPDL